ncbi:MAG: 16S rRNA (cytosine(1402)-N(4))-methyltransferase RsmH [candidate division WOR-3 bacterium]
MLNDINEKVFVFHQPVLVDAVIFYLMNKQSNCNLPCLYIDATVGGGGHTQAILEHLLNKKSIVIGLDCDQDAINYTKNRLGKYSNLYLFRMSYTKIDEVVRKFPEYSVQGVLFDFGASYYQLTSSSRGFSYQQNGPLDMRFDQSLNLTARDIIRRSSSKGLEKIFKEFGEERFAHKIAQVVYQHRNKINTTYDLVEIMQEIVPAYKIRKTLARIFQALRIAVNQELENIQQGLNCAIRILTTGGRIVTIAYHSLEDRIVKNTFRSVAQNNSGIGLKVLTKKPVRPSPKEVKSNPAARSARLRAAEKQ